MVLLEEGKTIYELTNLKRSGKQLSVCVSDRLHTNVDWSKLEIVLYTLVVLSCPTKLTGYYRTVSTFVLCSSELTRLN